MDYVIYYILKFGKEIYHIMVGNVGASLPYTAANNYLDYNILIYLLLAFLPARSCLQS